MNNSYTGYWDQIFIMLSTEPSGEVLRIEKHVSIHPQSAGARQSLGLPMGQQADFRWVAGDCRGLHVRDFGTHYEAHIDKVDPSCDLVEHLRNDAPVVYVAGFSALGALVGSIFGGRDAVLAGAALGATVGALAMEENRNGTKS